MDQHLNPALARARQLDLRHAADDHRLAGELRGAGTMSRISSAAARLVHRGAQPSPSRDL